MRKIFLLFLFAWAVLKLPAQIPIVRTLNDSVFAVGDVIKIPAIVYSTCHPFPRPEDLDSLRPIAVFLKKYPGIVVEIAAHSDSRGSLVFNGKLTQERAESIKKSLLNDLKCDPKQIKAKGYGETKPLFSDAEIANAKTKEEKEELHQNNRRTVLVVLSSKTKNEEGH